MQFTREDLRFLKLLGIDPNFEERQQSVGETIHHCLKRRGEGVVEQCRASLKQGWQGWERYRLTDEQLADFFQGKSQEAEQVADFLVKLGIATDPCSLFAIFVR